MRSILLKVFGIIVAFALGTWLARPLWQDFGYGWPVDGEPPPPTPFYERMLNQHPIMILTFAVVTVVSTVVSRRTH